MVLRVDGDRHKNNLYIDTPEDAHPLSTQGSPSPLELLSCSVRELSGWWTWWVKRLVEWEELVSCVAESELASLMAPQSEGSLPLLYGKSLEMLRLLPALTFEIINPIELAAEQT